MIDDDVFEVATAGDAHLGGEDFNNKAIDYFIDQYKKAGTTFPPIYMPWASSIARLRRPGELTPTSSPPASNLNLSRMETTSPRL